MDAPPLDSVGEGADDVLLTDHLPEALGTVAAVEGCGLGHESSLSAALGRSPAWTAAVPETPG
jgi:hypothetical protein